MKISKDALRAKLAAFATEWQGATREKQEAQQFWNAFCACFGLNKRGMALYEDKRRRLNSSTGYIDCFIPSKMLVEHKSANKNLDDAKAQAISYAEVLAPHEMPQLLVVCDFQNWRVWDLETDKEVSFQLEDLPNHWELFEVLQTGKRRVIVEEDEANRKAAYAIAELHEALLKNRFHGKDLEVFLTRIVFCLFADDTHIFERNHALRELIEQSLEDGSDLGRKLDELFNEALNVKESLRQSNSQLEFCDFSYINGDLFKDRYRIPRFNPELRAKMLTCAQLDWSDISPAIFGAMFQGVLEHGALDRKGARRELGAHYTSETNILRAIDPLVMDALRAELEGCKANTSKLQALHDKLAKFKFLDPACGCGNFLVITYRELRRIEHDLIERLYLRKGMGDNTQLLPMKDLIRTKVDQFYGIEIDDSAAHIARIALWITDHQMNLEAHKRFRGDTRPTVPIKSSPHIFQTNALRADWQALLPPSECSYIVGNPPFVGYSYQTKDQKSDLALVFAGMKGAGVLDYVAAWYIKAAHYMKVNPDVRCAFVSTNSITQGEQVAILWGALMQLGVHIHFAHRTFKWSNEGKGVAAVHCVIVGMGLDEPASPVLYDYAEDIAGEPVVSLAKHINPYLVDAPTVLLEKRTTPISNVIAMVKGSQPTDGGNLLLSDIEKQELIKNEPDAKKWIRPFLGAGEFINNVPRWCLWLKDISPTELRALPLVRQRVKAVKEMRQASLKVPTQNMAAFPTLFGEDRQTDKTYLLMPSVSSENRRFVPIGYFKPNVVASNLVFMLPRATLYHFGVLCSTMHNAWMRAVCGRLESRYRYSNTIVYNNFPWPQAISDKASKAIESAAQAVLDARAAYPDSSLADLYDPNTMPPVLVKAHQTLDKAVDAAYKYKGGKEDAPRVAFLFERYQALTSLLPAEKAGRRAVRK
ncbi:MAG: N-6 DNA methylase [Cytophagales bacterium]|nr:N-6 DNA methylase [Cytophagales bacterium]